MNRSMDAANCLAETGADLPIGVLAIGLVAVVIGAALLLLRRRDGRRRAVTLLALAPLLLAGALFFQTPGAAWAETDPCAPTAPAQQPQAPEQPSVSPEVLCAPGTTLVGDTCVTDPVECPDGQVLVAGACVPEEPIDCPDGQILVGDTCEPEVPVECPPGQVLVGDVCECPPGFQNQDGICIAITCDEGFVLDDNFQCVPIECEPGEVLQGNECVPAAPECGVNEEFDDVTQTCVCREGFIRDPNTFLCIRDLLADGVLPQRAEDFDVPFGVLV